MDELIIGFSAEGPLALHESNPTMARRTFVATFEKAVKPGRRPILATIGTEILSYNKGLIVSTSKDGVDIATNVLRWRVLDRGGMLAAMIKRNNADIAGGRMKLPDPSRLVSDGPLSSDIVLSALNQLLVQTIVNGEDPAVERKKPPLGDDFERRNGDYAPAFLAGGSDAAA